MEEDVYNADWLKEGKRFVRDDSGIETVIYLAYNGRGLNFYINNELADMVWWCYRQKNCLYYANEEMTLNAYYDEENDLLRIESDDIFEGYSGQYRQRNT